MSISPTPWTAEGGEILDAKRKTVADYYAQGDGVRGDLLAQGNGALIAAAPELHRELTDFHKHAIDQGFHDCDGIPGGCPVVAALKKAGGES